MKITVRMPTEQYAFQEVQFESLEEYNEKMPLFVKAYIQMKHTVKEEVKKLKEMNESPF